MNMNRALKIGVIGVGRMGARHCRVYSNMRKVHLFGVSDANPEIGVKSGKTVRCAVFP